MKKSAINQMSALIKPQKLLLQRFGQTPVCARGQGCIVPTPGAPSGPGFAVHAHIMQVCCCNQCFQNTMTFPDHNTMQQHVLLLHVLLLAVGLVADAGEGSKSHHHFFFSIFKLRLQRKTARWGVGKTRRSHHAHSVALCQNLSCRQKVFYKSTPNHPLLADLGRFGPEAVLV